MIAISINEFLANDVTETQVTLTGALPGQDVEAGVDVYAYVYSDIQGIELSLDGNSYSDEVRLLSNGTHTLYVRCGNVPGTYTEAVGYSYIDEDDGEQYGYFTVTVSGGTPPKFESISVSLAARSATLQYSANVVNTALSVGATLTGNILDHRYSFEIERIAEQGNKAAISGASFVNDLVNKLVFYQVKYEGTILLGWKRPKLTDHLNAISAAIGIDIVFRGADFYPKSDINIKQRQYIVFLSFYETFSGSFGEHINRLIGWSDTVPGMTYNLYIDGGKIYIIQRGYEENTLTPVNWTLRPTLTHTIRRTQWADSQFQDVVPKEISSSDASNSSEPFSGTLTWGTVNPTTLVYEDGYLIEETRGNLTTTYTYIDLATGGKTLQSKAVVDVDNDTHTLTTYSYETTGQQEYLYEEKTVVTEGTDGTGITLESSIIRHVPIGGGWYGTTTYDTTDGTEVEVSSSLGQGAPGQKVSQYMVDAQNDALKPDSAPRQMTVPLTGVAKARQTYPVADYDTLEAIAADLDRYEGAEEIMLQGEIAGGSHVYTFNDKITFNGNTYYIVSNSISQTYNQVRQSITATRWVLS